MTAKETPTAHLEDAEMISKIAIEEESLESKAKERSIPSRPGTRTVFLDAIFAKYCHTNGVEDNKHCATTDKKKRVELPPVLHLIEQTSEATNN